MQYPSRIIVNGCICQWYQRATFFLAGAVRSTPTASAVGLYMSISTGGDNAGSVGSNAPIVAGFYAVPLVYLMLQEATPHPVAPLPSNVNSFLGAVRVGGEWGE